MHNTDSFCAITTYVDNFFVPFDDSTDPRQRWLEVKRCRGREDRNGLIEICCSLRRIFRKDKDKQ